MFICIKMDLALNNLQWLMCHKTKPRLDGNPQAEKIFLPKDCSLMTCMKPMVTDKQQYY